MLKNIKRGDELEDGLIILDKFGGDSLTVKSKTGMGVVYIAFQKDTHQIFALKTFQDNLFLQNNLRVSLKKSCPLRLPSYRNSIPLPDSAKAPA